MRRWIRKYSRTSGRCRADYFPGVFSTGQQTVCCRNKVWVHISAAALGFLCLFLPFAAPGQAIPGSVASVDHPVILNAPTVSSSDAPNARSAAEEVRLGSSYLTGKGVPKDPVQSAYWFRKAADQGDAGAQNELGYFYTYGLACNRIRRKRLDGSNARWRRGRSAPS